MGPIAGPMATAGFVIVLVIFMLLKRQDLRNRLIGVIGYGHLTVTTKALDEAGSRVSRYLLMQSLLNLIFGVGVGSVCIVSTPSCGRRWPPCCASFHTSGLG